MAVAGWLGADYLSAEWVDDGYLRKQEYVFAPGAWVNDKYLSKKWISQSWVHYVDTTGTGATVTALNVPGLALAKLDGSARQTTKVNATTPALALAKLDAAVNASTKVTQANVPNRALAALTATTNGSVYQVANVTFVVQVGSTFGYTDLVAVQNVPTMALAAIDAIVTEGTDVNVAATKAALPLAVLLTSAKANASTRAVSSVPLPLQAFSCQVSIGKNVSVLNRPSVPLAAIPVAVVGRVNVPTLVTATAVALPLSEYSATVSGVAAPIAPAHRRRHTVIRSVDRSTNVIRKDRRVAI